jgi:hypothetical protein
MYPLLVGWLSHSVKTYFPFITKHLGYCGGVHALTDAVTTGNHIAPSGCPLRYTTIDLFTD